MIGEIGAEVYQAWSEEKRREEIEKLVAGYQNGLPVAVLCMTAGAIAGNPKSARQYLAACMSLDERKAAVASGTDELRPMLRSLLL